MTPLPAVPAKASLPGEADDHRRSKYGSRALGVQLQSYKPVSFEQITYP
jgi:hypothetical protein